MAFTTEDKATVVKAHGLHGTDSGSPEVQVALITARLNDLQGHFSQHENDYHSRRGLMKLVGRRKRLLNYLRDTDITRYRNIIEKLGLRK